MAKNAIGADGDRSRNGEGLLAATDRGAELELEGRRVLIVERNYYLAMDTARELKASGATILGPYPTEARARVRLKTDRPDAAVLDVDLGEGVSFRLADALASLGVPLVIVTGCEPEAIPGTYPRMMRLVKPVPPGRIAQAVARLLRG